MPTGSSLRRIDIGAVATPSGPSAGETRCLLKRRLSDLEILVTQIDGLQVSDDLALVAAVGIDAEGGTPSR